MESRLPADKIGKISNCSVLDLPVYKRSEWNNISIGDKFSITLCVTGKNILTIKSSGRITADIIEALIRKVSAVINKTFDENDDIIIIEDFEDLKKVSLRGRKRYIEFYQTLNNLKAVIVCTSSPLALLSLKLASRFNSADFFVSIEKSLNDGLKKAKGLLSSDISTVEALSVTARVPVTGRRYNEKCTFTGLPVMRKPEWTRIDAGGAQVTFWVIGGKILASTLYNWSDISIDTFRRLFELRGQVINEAFGRDGRFVEIRDYTNFKRGTSRKLRNEFISLMKSEEERVIGFIGYNAPLTVKFSFNVGQRLYTSPFPWKIVNNYNEAVMLALEQLKKKGYDIAKIPTIRQKDEWAVHMDGFSVKYQVVNGDILFRVSSGFLMPEHVDPSYNLQCRVVEEAGLYDKPHYFINDVTGLKGASFKARKKYFGYVMNWVNTYPGCRLTVMFGANRMVKASLAISNYLRPYQLTVCDTFEDALMKVSNDKIDLLKGQSRPYYIQEPEEDMIRSYSSELVEFLGNINWELDGYSDLADGVSRTHPFKTVFDAITLIKLDIDELFRDHEKTKVDLEESKKIANVLTQEIIKAQENERQRIARDLHDNVAQDLASLIISNDGLFEGFDDIPHDLRRRAMKNSRTLKRAIESIRDMAYDLRPPSLDQLGLVKTLSQYCNDFQETNMLSVDFYSAGVDELDLDFDTEINIYRVIQEALNNIKKHANATYVTIHLITSFPHIILKIEDDGDGFDIVNRAEAAVKEKRMGLKSMEERARLLSGDFALRSLVGKGTMIRLSLPYS